MSYWGDDTDSTDEAKLGRMSPKEVKDTIKRHIAESILDYFKEQIQAELISVDKVVTGEAFDSWHIQENADGNYELRSESAAMFVIEFGRSPGARPPPSHAISQWLQDKLGHDKETADRLSGKIAHNIGRDGIPETRIVRNVLAGVES